MDEREEFHKWLKEFDGSPCLEIMADGTEYCDWDIQRAWAGWIARAALAATQASQDAFVIQALVAAGHVTQQKVDEAYAIACDVLPTTQAGWISVKDRLPAAGEMVLVFRPDSHYVPACDPNIDVRKYFGDGQFRSSHEVTHWMPLPAAPESSEKEE